MFENVNSRAGDDCRAFWFGSSRKPNRKQKFAISKIENQN